MKKFIICNNNLNLEFCEQILYKNNLKKLMISLLQKKFTLDNSFLENNNVL